MKNSLLALLLLFFAAKVQAVSLPARCHLPFSDNELNSNLESLAHDLGGLLQARLKQHYDEMIFDEPVLPAEMLAKMDSDLAKCINQMKTFHGSCNLPPPPALKYPDLSWDMDAHPAQAFKGTIVTLALTSPLLIAQSGLTPPQYYGTALIGGTATTIGLWSAYMWALSGKGEALCNRLRMELWAQKNHRYRESVFEKHFWQPLRSYGVDAPKKNKFFWLQAQLEGPHFFRRLFDEPKVLKLQYDHFSTWLKNLSAKVSNIDPVRAELLLDLEAKHRAVSQDLARKGLSSIEDKQQAITAMYRHFDEAKRIIHGLDLPSEEKALGLQEAFLESVFKNPGAKTALTETGAGLGRQLPGDSCRVVWKKLLSLKQ